MLENGYKLFTTFPMDFSIADKFGLKAVKDTYNTVFTEWKSDYKYLTELVIVLNLKCWQHYHENNHELGRLYSDLYYKCKDYALDNLKGEEFDYFFEWTD